MPELPEIEHLRQSLAPQIIGARVVATALHRRDIAHCGTNGKRPTRHNLLAGQSIVTLHRLGKQLAIEGSDGSIICVHLGMTGQLRILPHRERVSSRKHLHCTWSLQRASGERSRMIFRDPRRFGGLWLFDSLAALRQERWSQLGPDALTISARDLAQICGDSKRPLKSLLLDQSRIAGVGNIYADESLFLAWLHPCVSAHEVDRAATTRLARAVRRVLADSINRGGTTFRDYVDGNGRAGAFVRRVKVYGRARQPCTRCRTTLESCIVAGRTTVFCPVCQPMA